jgi:hypothetical protein
VVAGVIGWYVHHAGYGHVARFLAVQPHLGTPVVAFSSLARPAGLADDVEWMLLPRDDEPYELPGVGAQHPADASPTARGALHWAPIGSPGHRRRLARIVQTVEERGVDTFVVDVSAEVTMLARVLGLRTVIVTQPGERTDRPHALAYDLAERIIAPWSEGTIVSTMLAARRDRTVYTGGISRFDGRPLPAASPGRHAVFLGRALAPDVLEDVVARLTDAGWSIDRAGTTADDRVDDPWPLLASGAVVVSAAGQNSVADLAAAGARAVVVAQERPFAEQAATAAVLARRGLAVVAPAEVDAAGAVAAIERAAATAPDWNAWGVAGAAARAARAVVGADG